MGDMSTIILAILVGVIVFTIYMAIDTYFRKQKQSEELKERIAGSSAATVDMSSGDDALMSVDQEMSPTAKSLSNILAMVGVTDEIVEDITKKFGFAGINSVDGPIYYLFAQRILSIFWVLLSIPLFLSSKTGTDYMLDILLGLLIAGLGIFGPYLYIKNKIQHRQKVLQNSFPDALDLLLVCVESGLALDAALSRVCRELGKAHPEVTKEFNRTRLELALLNDRSQALMNLGERTNLIPFRSLAAALIQTEKFGTSLTDTLRVLSDDYRQTRLLLAENKANRLPALITIPLITMLMPAFILIIIGPAIIRVQAQGGIFGGAAK